MLGRFIGLLLRLIGGRPVTPYGRIVAEIEGRR